MNVWIHNLHGENVDVSDHCNYITAVIDLSFSQPLLSVAVDQFLKRHDFVLSICPLFVHNLLFCQFLSFFIETYTHIHAYLSTYSISPFHSLFLSETRIIYYGSLAFPSFPQACYPLL